MSYSKMFEIKCKVVVLELDYGQYFLTLDK